MIRQHPTSTLFPYTTLFRSRISSSTPTRKRRQLYHCRYAFSPISPNVKTRITAAQNSDRKSTRLNSSHGYISYAVFCLKKKTKAVNTRPSFVLIQKMHILLG